METEEFRLIEKLNEKNPGLSSPIRSVHHESFRTYGRVVTGYDFSALIDYMDRATPIPGEGNVYLPSVEEMEAMPAAQQIQAGLYGGMPIEIGYCNGRNSTFNGMEYHKGSEINIACTDLLLILGHTWDIRDNTYRVEDAQVFFLAKGEAIEMFQTTLHLSPCKVSDEGFRDIVVLPRGTNTPLEERPEVRQPEDRLLLHKNKWVIAHPEREPLIKQGAYPGILGENIALHY